MAMKTAQIFAGLVAALFAAISTASAEPSLSFPNQRIGLPALSLAEVAQGAVASSVKTETPLIDVSATKSAPALRRSDDKFVMKPDDSVDYKLTIKAPGASIDYRMIVKNPDALRKK